MTGFVSAIPDIGACDVTCRNASEVRTIFLYVKTQVYSCTHSLFCFLLVQSFMLQCFYRSLRFYDQIFFPLFSLNLHITLLAKKAGVCLNRKWCVCRIHTMKNLRNRFLRFLRLKRNQHRNQMEKEHQKEFID